MSPPPVPSPVIVWFRRDLRLGDNPALHQALGTGAPVLPLYILEDFTIGAASRWWLHMSLAQLGGAMEKLGSRLILRRGKPSEILAGLAKKHEVSAVYWNRIYDPGTVEQDRDIARDLKAAGISSQSFKGGLLSEPWDIKTGAGKPYSVFTPFFKQWRSSINPAPPLPAPRRIKGLSGPQSDRLEDWGLRPSKPDWAGGMAQSWQPGEAGAAALLDRFANESAGAYERNRDFPAITGTSRLSPHLHFGEISPGQIWHRLQRQMMIDRGSDSGTMAFLRQLCWRDFCHALLFHNPELPRQNLKREFDAFPWIDNPAGLKAWQQGRTGYPIVDAGMRELWQTGWMHNRLRMITASFLIKDLMIDWREGEKWFWDTLVDADLANNAAGWQWVAGSGADASPFFRVFNPVLQGQKFDAQGAYIRRWIPELAALPAKYIHDPWTAPSPVTTYPKPIIDHALARNRALEAYKSIR